MSSGSNTRSRNPASAPPRIAASNTDHSTANPRLLYETARPGSQVSAASAARRRNSPRGARAVRNSRSSGSRSGKPDVCVSRCRTRTARFFPDRNGGRNSATRSPRLSSPRSTASRASPATTGFVSEATANAVSAVVNGPSDSTEPLAKTRRPTDPRPTRIAAAASPHSRSSSGPTRAQRSGSRPAAAGSVVSSNRKAFTPRPPRRRPSRPASA